MRKASDEIRGTYGDELRGKKILLIVTGSIAAYKAPDLARELVRYGAEVTILPSKAALRYITLETLRWSVGGDVIEGFGHEAGHIYMVENMDLVLVAPATANIISKAAYGIADTDASLAIHSALGFGKPLVFVPVMHLNMMDNPAYREAVERLKSYGVVFVDPLVEEGKAKFPPLKWILMEVFKQLYPKPLKNLRLLVTAGPTYEYIDPIRIITNKSSGKMGVYLAEEAYLLGGDVTLVHGPIQVEPYHRLRRVGVETTEDMYEAVMNRIGDVDVYISAAAPVDYRPTNPSNVKIDTQANQQLDLELILTPKIVAEARKRRPDLFIVSFKALYNVDDDELVEKAAEHARRYGFDLTVANDVSRSDAGFQVETNRVVVVDREGRLVKRIIGPKRYVAREILSIIAEKLGRK